MISTMTSLKPSEKPKVSAASSSVEHGCVMTTREIRTLWNQVPYNAPAQIVKIERDRFDEVKWVRQDTIREIMEALVDAERIAHYGQTNSERRVIVEYERDTLRNWKVFSEVL
jgi:hypothetical protein